jgi:hypothetical protein
MKSFISHSCSIVATLAFSTSVCLSQTSNVEKQLAPEINSLLPNPTVSSGANVSSDYSTNDSGAQRPVSLKSSAFSVDLNYDTKIKYVSNPLNSSESLSKSATGLWTHSFGTKITFGDIDFDNAVVLPSITGNWTAYDYTEDPVAKILNKYTTGAGVDLETRFPSNLRLNVGVNYSMQNYSNIASSEEFSAYQPYISLQATRSLESALVFYGVNVGMLDADLEVLETPFNNANKNQADQISTTAMLGFQKGFGDFSFVPYFTSTYSVYDTGKNKDRKDWINQFGLNVSYPIVNDVDLSLQASYIDQSVDGTSDTLDYKSWTSGIGINLNTKF